MTARRRLLAAVSTCVAVAALSGCEKPAPIVTVVSGGTSVYSEAALFCFEEGANLQSAECAQRATDVKRLKVRPGERVGIDVDKELVDRGWQLEIADPQDPQRTQASGVLTDHYFPFTAPAIAPDGTLLLTVRTLDASNQPTGEWQFELVGEQ